MDVLDHAGPLVLARERRGEAAFQECPLAGQGQLIVAAQILLWEFRVGRDDVMDPGTECGVRNGPW
jgi:hypothetical protein